MRSGSRAAYALAAVLRVALVFAPSYIHPDEAFQSPEVMAGWLLGKGVRVPWEFSDCVHPARSIALPYVPACERRSKPRHRVNRCWFP